MKEIWISALLLLIVVVAILLPIVPATVAYRLSPDKPISAEGVLSGFTIKTGGAFSAYLIVLLILIPFLNLLAQAVTSYLKPAWTITVPIVIQDKNGQNVTLAPSAFQNVEVVLSPRMSSGGNKQIQFSVVGDVENWPHTVWFKIPPGYVGSFNLRGNKYVILNGIEKTAEIEDLVTLRDESIGNFSSPYQGNP